MLRRTLHSNRESGPARNGRRTGALISSLLLAWLALAAPAEVVQTHGPPGGEVSALLELDGTLFLGTGGELEPNEGGHVFLSSDDGASWQRAGTGLPSAAVYGFEHADGTIFVATALGIYRSDDGGVTWQGRVLPSFHRATAIATNGDGDLLAGGSGFFYRSEDAGDSWLDEGQNLPGDLRIQALLASDADVFAGGYDGGGSPVVYQREAGEWALNHTFGDGSLVDVFALHAGSIFAGVRGLGLQASPDGGDTWQASNTGLPEIGPIIVDVVSIASDLYVTDRTGVYKSSNDGASFEPRNEAVCACDTLALAFSGSTLVLGTTRGLWRSFDDGVAWSPSNDGLVASWVDALAELSTGRLVAGTRHGDLFLSDDGGDSWQKPTTSLEAAWIRGLGVTENETLYAASWTQGVLRSTTAGSTWNFVLLGQGFHDVATVGNTVYVQDVSGGVWEGTNDGLDWALSNDGLNLSGDRITALIEKDDVLYAGSFSGQIYLRDGAPPWVPLGTSLAGEVTGLGVTAGGDVWASTQGGGPHVLADGESDFVAAGEGLPYPNTSWLRVEEDTAYLDLGGLTEGVYARADGEASWQPFDAGQPVPVMASMLATDDVLYLGTQASGLRAVVVPAPSASIAAFAALSVLAVLRRGRSDHRVSSLPHSHL